MKVTNILALLLFILSFAIAVYVVANCAAPWKLISMYWITVAAKNGMDYIDGRVKK